MGPTGLNGFLWNFTYNDQGILLLATGFLTNFIQLGKIVPRFYLEQERTETANKNQREKWPLQENKSISGTT